MRTQIKQEEINQIEKVIDRVGLAEFTEAIAAIAVSKSIYLETNWQDDTLAKTWTRVARKFDKLIPALELNDDILGFNSRSSTLKGLIADLPPNIGDAQPMYLGKPYWHCPNNEQHGLKYYRGLNATIFYCNICDIPAIWKGTE